MTSQGQEFNPKEFDLQSKITGSHDTREDLAALELDYQEVGTENYSDEDDQGDDYSQYP